MKIEFVISDTVDDCHFNVFEIEELEDIEDELEACLDEVKGATLRVYLHRPPMDALNVTECFDHICSELSCLQNAPSSVQFLVKNERIATTLKKRIMGGDGRTTLTLNGLHLVVQRGDITQTRCDAIVNASNTRLKLGSGVSGAIKRAAGAGLQGDMYARAPLARGAVVVTSSHGMPYTRKILHVATASGHIDDIRPACAAILDRADQLKLSHIAIPAIGAGVGSMPAATCAELLKQAVQEFKPRTDGGLRKVTYVLWDQETWQTFSDVFKAG